MKKSFLLTGAIILAVAIQLFAQKTIVLKSGTPILLEVSQQLDSKNLQMGSAIDLRLRSDFKIGDKTVILAGSSGKGQVTMIQQPKKGGMPGIIEIQPSSIKAIDGTLVGLSGAPIRREGKNKKTLSWGLAIGGCFVVSPLSFLFLLIKGEDGVIPAGTTIDATVSNNANISIE